jgi:hypothetical protein
MSAVEYTGHHPQHAGLQGHSVGGIYPLTLVVIDNPGAKWGVAREHAVRNRLYVIMDATTGLLAGYTPGGRYWTSIDPLDDGPCPRIFTSSEDALDWADRYTRKVYTDPVNWVPNPSLPK